MNVFIDANIYLTFIESKKAEKLSSLSIFRKNMTKRGINLIFPQITYEEVMRRVPKIKADSSESLRKFIPTVPSLPTSVRSNKTQSGFEKLVKRYKEKIKKLDVEYLKSVDKLLKDEIEQLYIKAEVIATTNELLQRAGNRHVLGNPPGKGGNSPIGDELEWEILLEHCAKEDLVIVTNDSDWKERNLSTGKDEIKDFLSMEWKRRSDKELAFYSTLGEFVNDRIKPQKLVDEKEIVEEKIISGPIESAASFFYSSQTPTIDIAAGYPSVASSSPVALTTNPVWNNSATSATPFSLTGANQPIQSWSTTGMGSFSNRACPVCGQIAGSLDSYCSGCGRKLV